MIVSDRDKEQQKALESIREDLKGNGKALCVACTGYGKGHLIKKIAKTLKGTMLVIVPRVNLVSDIAERIGDEANVYCASLGRKEEGKIIVGTIQSLSKKIIEADLIVMDEAHNYTQETLDSLNYKYLIGLTATPFTNQGFIYGNGKFWPKPCYEYLIDDAIKNKFLCDYKIFSSENAYKFKKSLKKTDFTENEVKEIIKTSKLENIIGEVNRICILENRKRIVYLCSSIDHAEQVAELEDDFVVIHSKVKNASEKIQEFKDGKYRKAISVMMLSEGFDCPDIDCVVYLRPTRSTRLMIQSAGRGLRFSEGKKDCLMLDYGHVFSSCGNPKKPIYNFLPASKKQEEIEKIKVCPECYFVHDSGPICPSCGHVSKLIIDRNEKLSSTITEENVESVFLDGSMYKYESRTKRNAKFICYELGKDKFMFFGGNYFKARKKQPMKVKYLKNNDKIKIISVTVFD